MCDDPGACVTMPMTWLQLRSDTAVVLECTLCEHICSMLADIVQRVYILKYLLWFGAFLLGWNEGGGCPFTVFFELLG